jgi:hypothetical protein
VLQPSWIPGDQYVTSVDDRADDVGSGSTSRYPHVDLVRLWRRSLFLSCFLWIMVLVKETHLKLDHSTGEDPSGRGSSWYARGMGIAGDPGGASADISHY